MNTATKERPILFRPELVRKILSGAKTQTRRPVKPQSLFDGKNEILRKFPEQSGCSFGQVGDVLWVRETWRHYGRERAGKIEGGVQYRADLASKCFTDFYDPIERFKEFEYEWWILGRVNKWRPSIHMPRWACRLRLEITDVRVERIQSISAKDIMAEGVVDRAHESQFGKCPVSTIDGAAYMDLQSLWAAAWEKAYKGSWQRNEWVWVLSFEVCDE